MLFMLFESRVLAEQYVFAAAQAASEFWCRGPEAGSICQKKGPRPVSICKKRWRHSLEYFTILVREGILRSAQQMCMFTYSQTFDINSVNCFRLHEKTVQCVLPRCNKYSKAPRNVNYSGTLKKMYHHCAWPFIMRPLNVGYASSFSSSD